MLYIARIKYNLCYCYKYTIPK